MIFFWLHHLGLNRSRVLLRRKETLVRKALRRLSVVRFSSLLKMKQSTDNNTPRDGPSLLMDVLRYFVISRQALWIRWIMERQYRNVILDDVSPDIESCVSRCSTIHIPCSHEVAVQTVTVGSKT